MNRNRSPRLYTDLADWFHLLSDPKDYAGEAKWIAGQLAVPGVKWPTLLELGAGGGNNAVHLKKRFAMTLTDLSPQMLKLSKRINPELPHKTGDMRTLRLNAEFDAILVHDAVMYLTAPRDLKRLAKTIAIHLKPEGHALIMPDWIDETFAPKLGRGGHAAGVRSLQYVHTEKRRANSTKVDVTFTLNLGEHGRSRIVADRHVLGVFPRALWTEAFRAESLTVKTVTDPWSRTCFLCRNKPN